MRIGAQLRQRQPLYIERRVAHERVPVLSRAAACQTGCLDRLPASGTLAARLPPLEYPGHFETRLVSRNSGIRWKKQWVRVTHTLAGEYVGLEEVGDELWDVCFGPVALERVDERTGRITDHKGRTVRRASPADAVQHSAAVTTE